MMKITLDKLISQLFWSSIRKNISKFGANSKDKTLSNVE